MLHFKMAAFQEVSAEKNRNYFLYHVLELNVDSF
jgi:hypothetical protein